MSMRDLKLRTCHVQQKCYYAKFPLRLPQDMQRDMHENIPIKGVGDELLFLSNEECDTVSEF